MLQDETVAFMCVGMPMLGFLWAFHNQQKVAKIKIVGDSNSEAQSVSGMSAADMRKVYDISNRIAVGADAFLKQEYTVIMGFLGIASVVIYTLIGLSGGDNSWLNAKFTCIAFIVGAVASCVSGAIGMRIATFTNSRTAHEATVAHGAEKYVRGFSTAFRGGIVMGFALTSVGLISLYLLIRVFSFYRGDADKVALYECIAAYGLGGSAVACFGRVGGGIFTKAADVGADLCGKVVAGLPEDDPRNPGVIADCIGDNVGDIAGMGSDLFGSFGEATCACLVVSAYASKELTDSTSAMMYPLMITGVGMMSCIITSLLVTLGVDPVTGPHNVEKVLKGQLIWSTVINTGAMYWLAHAALPATFSVAKLLKDPTTGAFQTADVTAQDAFYCVAMGLWSGLVIGYLTEYYTSNRKAPVESIAYACTMGGAATNVICGLSVGYNSTVIPCFVMALAIYVSFNLCLMYGISLAALGILSTMAIGYVGGLEVLMDNSKEAIFYTKNHHTQPHHRRLRADC